MEKKVIQIEANLTNLEKRCAEDRQENSRRLGALEKTMSEVNAKMDSQGVEIDNISVMANETRKDIKKGTWWLVGTGILFILGIVATLITTLAT